MFGSGKAGKPPKQVSLTPDVMATLAGIAPQAAQSAEGALHPRIIPLGPDSVLARTHWGFYLAVPMWNVDVVPGIVRDSIIERHTTAVARALAKPGMKVVNAGANFGYYSMLYASIVGASGSVFSIEANANIIPFLMRSIYWAGYPNVVRLFHTAVSDRSGDTIEIMFDPQFIGGGAVASGISMPKKSLADCLWEVNDLSPQFDANREWKLAGFMSMAPVETRTIDDICADAAKIDVIHMDIEGSEVRAIRGAMKTLARSPDIAMIVEWSPYYNGLPENRSAAAEVMGALFAQGFKYYFIDHARSDDATGLPMLKPIADMEQLFNTPHSDVLIVRDVARATAPNNFIIG